MEVICIKKNHKSAMLFNAESTPKQCAGAYNETDYW